MSIWWILNLFFDMLEHHKWTPTFSFPLSRFVTFLCELLCNISRMVMDPLCICWVSAKWFLKNSCEAQLHRSVSSWNLWSKPCNAKNGVSFSDLWYDELILLCTSLRHSFYISLAIADVDTEVIQHLTFELFSETVWWWMIRETIAHIDVVKGAEPIKHVPLNSVPLCVIKTGSTMFVLDAFP